MDIRDTIRNLLGLKNTPEDEGLAGFSDEQLAAAEAKAREVFASARDERNVQVATSSRDVVVAIKEELSSRASAAAEIDSTLAALEGDITVESDQDGSDDEGDETEEEEETPEEAPAGTPDPEVVVETPVPVAVAADAEPVIEPVTPTAPKLKTAKPSKAPAPAKPLVSITASADIDQFSPGQTMTLSDVGDAFVAKSEAVIRGRRVGRSGVASMHLNFPSERSLERDVPADINQEKINEVIAAAREATMNNLRQILAAGRDTEQVMELAAAGGLCAPLTPRYDICQQGDDVRPLRDSLVRFGATRGGITYLTPPRLSDVDGSVATYTADQDATGYDYPKDCIRVECGTPVSVEVQAITLCMEVGNFQRISFPENFRAWWHYGQVAHARQAETEIWDRMVTLSTPRNESGNQDYGAYPSTLNMLERYVEQFRYEYREPNTPLRMWAPTWMRAVLRADLANRAPGDSTLSVTDATLAQHLAARGIAVTWVLDGQSPNSGTTAFPNTVQVVLALEGTFLFLDMGRLDFGTEIRDFDQIRQNDSGAFMETFENVAAVCNGPQVITLPICPTGTYGPAATALTC